MSEKSKKLMLIFSICLNIGFLLIAAYAQFQRVNRSHKSRHLAKLDASVIFQTVDLNQRQKAEIDQLVQVFRANILSVNKAAAPLKADLFKGMATSPPISEAEAQKIIHRMSTVQNQRGELIYQHLKNLRQTLNEEQANKVFHRFAEIQDKWLKKVGPVR